MHRWRAWLDHAKSAASAPPPKAAASNWRFAGDGSIQGTLSWPHDDLFRPSVGLFVSGRMVAARGTRRARPTGKGAAWDCVFRFEDVEADRSQIQIVCLESGELLQAPADIEPRSTDIAALARSACSTFGDLTGFPSFLKLPVPDQIRLLYLEYLYRHVDPSGLKDFSAVIGRGDADVLMVRDMLLGSDEFNRRGLASTERLGRSLVWGGFHVVEALGGLLTPPSAYVSGAPEPTERDRQARVARLALGPGADEALVMDWLAQHRSLVADVLAEAPSRREGSERQQDAPRFRALERAMHPGEAGRGEVGRVRSILGAVGLFAYGPYVSLPPGGYRLTAKLHKAQLASPAARLGCEIYHGQYVLQVSSIALDGPDEIVEATIDFHIPEEVSALTEAPAWEFRFFSDGQAEVELAELRLEGGETLPGGASDLLPVMKYPPQNQDRGRARPMRLTGPGYAVYGPYRRFVPGRYQLEVELASVEEHVDIELEILRGASTVWSQGIRLTQRGFKFEPTFLCSPDDPDFEFRLDVKSATPIEILEFSVRPLHYQPVARKRILA